MYFENWMLSLKLTYTKHVISHLEPDILECKVKWALGSITTNKASGGDGIPVELFQILKDNAVKVLHPIGQQIWKTQQWPQDWKRSVFILIPKKRNCKECSNYHTIALSIIFLHKWLITFSSVAHMWNPGFIFYSLFTYPYIPQANHQFLKNCYLKMFLNMSTLSLHQLSWR